MSYRTMNRRSQGFTLAELLIALAILGELATFTIPKILNAQQRSANNAIAKEAAGTIEAAYQQHKFNGSLSANTYNDDLMQYINYVSVTTTGSIDDRPNYNGSIACTNSSPCYRLHNGAVLQAYSNDYFGGTATTNYIDFTIDPDGTYTGNADSLRLLIYYNGRLVSRNDCLTGSQNSGGVGHCGPATNADPSWFSW